MGNTWEGQERGRAGWELRVGASALREHPTPRDSPLPAPPQPITWGQCWEGELLGVVGSRDVLGSGGCWCYGRKPPPPTRVGWRKQLEIAL